MGLRGNPWEVIAYGPPWDGILTTALFLRGPMVGNLLLPPVWKCKDPLKLVTLQVLKDWEWSDISFVLDFGELVLEYFGFYE